MKNVKISIDEYTKQKKKLKFLEFYWSEYGNKVQTPELYPYFSEIDQFIRQELYDQINSIKVHSLTKRVTISEENYDLLKTYSHISDDLHSQL